MVSLNKVGKKRGMLSRADLLSCLDHYGESHLSEFAALAGFAERPVKKSALLKKKALTAEARISTDVESPKSSEHRFPENSGKGFWRVVSHQFNEREVAGGKPDWVNQTEPITAADEVHPDCKVPVKSPPVPWSRLWPFLRMALGHFKSSQRVDLKALTDLVAKAENFHRLPYLKKKKWAVQCQILIDCSDRNQPFWDDFGTLITQLEQLRGKNGLQTLLLEDGPGGDSRTWQQWQEPLKPYALPVSGTPLLILGDLGCYDTTDTSLQQWISFGKTLQKAGLKPIALMTCPPRLWSEALAQSFQLVCWDRGQKLPLRPGQLSSGARPVVNQGRKHQRLLSLLSPAIRIEPELLRAVRQLLPPGDLDIGCEAEVWMHPDTLSTPIAFAFKQSKIELYRKGFQQEHQLLQEKVLSTIKRFHQHLPASIAYEEKLTASNFMEQQDSEAELYFQKIYKSIEAGHREIPSWLKRVGFRQHQAMWKHSEALSASWAKVYQEALKNGPMELPPGFELDRVAWVLSAESSPRQVLLVQEGPRLTLIAKEAKDSLISDNGFEVTTPIAELSLHSPFTQLQSSDPKLGENFALPIDWSVPCEIPLPVNGPLILKTESDCVTLAANVKPTWADNIGQDHIGFYAEFSFKGVVQRMRWVPPGKFMMGSPEDEAERLTNEQQHEVTLTQGFWLADTSCTQELWQVVMGENPSRFKGRNLPVEKVRWKDTQKFIHQLNQEKEDLNLRLPSEAEWEYACRAATQTAFSFGDQITSEQVNYRGTAPYANGEKGEYRKKTVAVKSLPSNAWGFYEMHGNVWEWCADRYEKNPMENNIDPMGPDKGVYRVLRGGSWFFSGMNVRSAYRYHVDPDFRSVNIGFRLARGH